VVAFCRYREERICRAGSRRLTCNRANAAEGADPDGVCPEEPRVVLAGAEQTSKRIPEKKREERSRPWGGKGIRESH